MVVTEKTPSDIATIIVKAMGPMALRRMVKAGF
jgi:hypothetical protein